MLGIGQAAKGSRAGARGAHQVRFWLTGLLGVFLLAGSAYGQQTGKEITIVEAIDEFSATEICQLPPSEYQGNIYLRVPESVVDPGKTAAATFSVTYTGFTAEAQAAFQRAVDTWAALLTSSQTIHVNATFAALGPGILGSAGPNGGYLLTGGPIPSGQRWAYGRPLAEALLNTNTNGTSADINATFSSAFSDWHFGTEDPPPGLIDFESVVLHELGHGLNFTRYATVSGGTGTLDVFGNATYLDYGVNEAYFEDGSSVMLRDTGTYTDPSAGLGTALTGGAGGVFFNGSNATLWNGATPPRIYTPATFASGSSLSHLDEATFNGTLSALMTPSISYGEIARTPGAVGCALLQDLGWSVDIVACSNLALPVELTTFDALAAGHDVLLNWETASEVNNAGFEVEHRYFDGPFEHINFVEGYGTTNQPKTYTFRAEQLEAGRHYFRLKQVDYDGTFEYSPEIEVSVELPGTFELSNVYPNPFNPQAQFSLIVARAQQARVEVYDAQGRRVALLHNGTVEANELYRFTFDAHTLPSGLYLVRVLGETFMDTRSAVLMK